MEREKHSQLPQQKTCVNICGSLVSVAVRNARESGGTLSMKAGGGDQRTIRQSAKWICQGQACTGVEV